MKNNIEKETDRKNESLFEEIEIPEGIEVTLNNDFLVMKKKDREIKRKLISLINFKFENNKIVISSKRNRRIERRLFWTFSAHIKNMIKGLTEGFTYKLKIANVHFPMNVKYDNNKFEFIIKNFLGEKKDRVIKLVPEVNVKIKDDEIILDSYDIEKAGHAATLIEKVARVRNKDRRVYQDGIFIIEKPGRVYL